MSAWVSPKQRSAKFLIRMFVTFLLRTDPASRKAKPACCWKKEFHFSIEIMDLHEDDDGSVDDEEELVHVCLHRVKVSTRLALKVQKVEKKNSPPVQALTDLIVVLVQEWTQQPRRFHHLGGDQVQEESWWEEEVQGLPGQKDLPSFFNAP